MYTQVTLTCSSLCSAAAAWRRGRTWTRARTAASCPPLARGTCGVAEFYSTTWIARAHIEVFIGRYVILCWNTLHILLLKINHLVREIHLWPWN